MFTRTVYLIVLIAIFAAAILTVVLLLRVTAPYGKHVRTGWGVSVKPRWAWLVMESPASLVIALMCVTALLGWSAAARSPVGIVPIVLFGMWELHYVYRAFVYPFLLKEGSRRDFPAVIALMAIVYNVANGYVNGFGLFFGATPYPISWLWDPRFIIGAAMFLTGYVIHIQSDSILRGLRAPGESGYKIPTGGLFRYISAPNYFGEVVQWTGWAIATWSLAGLSFAVFTAANLVPRAFSSHRWYRATFADYPPERRAILPLPRKVRSTAQR